MHVFCWQLDSIRCCGHGESLLLIEVDRSSMVDSGELWLSADDSMIARSMHDTLVRYNNVYDVH